MLSLWQKLLLGACFASTCGVIVWAFGWGEARSHFGLRFQLEDRWYHPLCDPFSGEFQLHNIPNLTRVTSAMLHLALDVAVAARDLHWTHAVLELMFTARSAPSAEAADTIRSMPRNSMTAGVHRLLAAFRQFD